MDLEKEIVGRAEVEEIPWDSWTVEVTARDLMLFENSSRQSRQASKTYITFHIRTKQNKCLALSAFPDSRSCRGPGILLRATLPMGLIQHRKDSQSLLPAASHYCGSQSCIWLGRIKRLCHADLESSLQAHRQRTPRPQLLFRPHLATTRQSHCHPAPSSTIQCQCIPEFTLTMAFLLKRSHPTRLHLYSHCRGNKQNNKWCAKPMFP